MKPLAIVGLVLIVLGVGGLIFRQFSVTTEKKVLDVGPLQATVDEEHSVRIPEIAGIVSIVAGGLLIFLARKNA